MAFDLRHPLVSDAVPDDLPCLFVEAIDMPGMWRGVFVHIYVAVQAVTKILTTFAAHRSGHEDSIAPDYRACMCEPRNRSLPQNIRALGCVPGSRRRLTFGKTGRICSPE